VTKHRHSAGIKAFGAKIREVRKSKNLTQEQLAWRADIELSQVSRIERGIINTTISQVFALAEALEVSHAVLFDFPIQSDTPPTS
jgi:transcriptional regulator with XRE-family HTH domain